MPQIEEKTEETTKLAPQFNVILWNDDDHSFEYVIEMLAKLFGHPHELGFLMAWEVHSTGRCIVATLDRERAEFKRDQIHAYGADPRIPRCAGSMSASLEALEP